MIFYKRKIIMFWGISILVFIFMVLFKYLVPVMADKAPEIGKLVFSKDSGFYDEEFELELSTETGTIYYTLDGTLPDKNAIRYEKPILIKDATSNENVYSMRTDVSTGFDKEEIERVSSDYPAYQAPGYKVDKATIVRAVVYDGMGNYGDVKTASYFVGFQNKDGYDGMKILSIVTEPSSLFDYETGIYVTGKTYDDYVKEYRGGDEYYWREEFWALWMANYRNRGAKWERKAACQFFDESRQLICGQECGIRIHGGISRGYNPKSLNIYAREEYDGNKRFQGDFFGTGYYASAVTLFQGGNELRTKAKDYLESMAAKSLNFSTMNFEPYVLFLNGEYWGIYWLNEKYDARYLEHYYNVDKDNVIMIKSGELAEGEDEDFKYYSKMMEFCTQSNITQDVNYRKACEMIDMQSCIDYYAFMIYIARSGDWPSMNYALWRVKKSEDSPYGDKKWRWMIYDLNSPGSGANADSINYVMENDAMFKNLMTNDTFRTQLILRVEELSDTVFAFDIMNDKISEYQQFISEPMKENDRRFYGEDSLAAFDSEIELLRDFFAQRKKYLLPILDNYK